MRQTWWGLLDQGLYSGTNLLLTIVVVRTVDIESFGAFSVCYVIYMFALALARVTGSKPYTIEHTGPRVDPDGMHAASMLGFTLALGGLWAALCLAAATVTGAPLSGGLVALAALMPGLLLQDAVRGLYFARVQARGAFANDALWTVLQAIAIVAVLLPDGPPRLPMLLAAWGVPAAVAAVVGALHLRCRPATPRMMSWLRSHAALARPLALNLVLTAAPAYLAYLAMPLVSSLDELAVVRGAYVFFGPLNVVYTGVAMVALPAAVRASPRLSRRRMSFGLSGVLAVTALGWATLVVLLPDRVGTLVLGDLWQDTGTTRLLLGVSLVAEAVLVGPEIVLSSLRIPHRMTPVRLAGALVTLVGALGLAAVWGAEGLAAGFALGYWVAALLATVQVSRAVRGAAVAPPVPAA